MAWNFLAQSDFSPIQDGATSQCCNFCLRQPPQHITVGSGKVMSYKKAKGKVVPVLN
jgi:hypothetical protein